MFQSIIEWLLKAFGVKPQKTQAEQEMEAKQLIAYENIAELNLTAMVASKISNIVCGDSTIEVTGTSPRVEYMQRTMKRVVDRMSIIADRALGTGGVILKPYTVGTEQYVDLLPQTRFFVVEKRGEVPIKVQFHADEKYDTELVSSPHAGLQQKDVLYVRLEYHTLAENGTYTIENKAMKDGAIVPLASVSEWAEIPELITITGVNRMLFSFIKCPIDSRSSIDDFRGVPLTYGQDKLIRMILDVFNEIPDEYRNKKAFVGVDDLLFNGSGGLPSQGIYRLFRTSGKDKSSLFDLFSPEIRHTAYFDGIDKLMGLLEKAIGVNKGVLTDMETADATATAIKRSTFDTFNLVAEIRKNIAIGMEQLAYAFDVQANAGNFAPRGDFDLSFDWSYSLLEDSQETFDQIRQTVSDGGLGIEYQTGYVLSISPEEALEKLPELAEPPTVAME